MGSVPLHKPQSHLRWEPHPLQIPIRHRGLCLPTCREQALVLHTTHQPHFSCLVSIAMPSTHTLLRRTCATAKGSFWGSQQREKLSTAPVHSPRATASQET